MSKKNLKILAIAAVAFATSNPAFAAVGDACKMTFSAGGGYAMSEKQEYKFSHSADTMAKIEAQNTAAITFSDVMYTANGGNKGYFGEIGVGYYINDNVNLGVSFGFTPKSLAKSKTQSKDGYGYSELKTVSYNGMLRAKYDFIISDSSISPFIEGAAGVEQNEVTLEKFNVDPASIISNDTRAVTSDKIVKSSTSTYSLAQKDAKMKKKTSARLELGGGVQYIMGNTRLSAAYIVGYSQGASQKSDEQFISYPKIYAAAGTDSALAIKSFKTSDTFTQMFRIKMDYVF
ncbi:outer membrane beta-barrel protein [Lyticum sinuosum]|uniref:Outer membrane protein beta-barrel domain-containing protein n=1 Tax=Lyticum sinuosum TaxID=1332059 RepID=A0AAE4VK91_9RICK|nr:outer membrane beta-barrel protein [Lyticum sinuosum]MDZ5761337.1 hypothetical protein [Lyticum sinuosum]